MIVVDSHSKLLEVLPMATTTAERTIEKLLRLFAWVGLPEQLVPDNGPHFTALEFQTFLKLKTHLSYTIPPCHKW